MTAFTIKREGTAWLRAGFVIAVALSIAILCVLSTAGQIAIAGTGSVNARSWFSAEANGRRASELLADENAGSGSRAPGAAIALARASLNRKPLSESAVRALGLAQALTGHPSQALRIFNYAQQMSRRDAGTQIWLLEERVTAGDIAGALRHYDIAMRTSEPVRATLLPTLAQASNEPAVARAVARLLAARPNWWPEGLQAISGVTTSPVEFASIVSALRLDAAKPDEKAVLAASMTKLAELGRSDLALRLYPTRSDVVHASIGNGTFDGKGGLSPFFWQLNDSEQLSAIVEPRDGGRGNVLSYVGEVPGLVARELILYPPGSYMLTARAGRSDGATGGGMRITISCAGRASQILASMPLALVGVRPVAFPVTVPQGCSAQWLRIDSLGSNDPEDAMWIDDLKLARR